MSEDQRGEATIRPGHGTATSRAALWIGVASILISVGVGVWSYATTSRQVRDGYSQTNLTLARALAAHANCQPSPAIALVSLESIWQRANWRPEGAFLCVVRHDGTLGLHTRRPQRVGMDVSAIEIPQSSGPRTVGELVAARQDWIGENTSHAGQRQIVAYVYSQQLDSLIAVHVPASSVYASIRRAALPWGLALAFVALLLWPLALLLLHRSHRRAQQHAARSFEERERAQRARDAMAEQLSRAQRLESVGRLAGGLAHDFNNILTAMFGSVESAREELRGPPRCLDEIEHQCQRASDLTRQLLAFSRQSSDDRVVIDPGATLARMHNLLSRLIREDIDLRITAADDAGNVRLGRGHLEQIVMNLVLNAADAMPSGGLLHLAVACPQDSDAGDADAIVELAVTDTGDGIDEELREKIFDPFFTTKGPSRGTGLGLASVHGIVQQAGGRVLVESELGRGTTFRVQLPRVDDDVVEVRPDRPLRRVAAREEAILLVEDDAAVRSTLCRILESRGYRVLEAARPNEALRIAADPDQDIALMMSDLVMPEQDGRALALEVRRLRPALPIVLMSGHWPDVVPRPDPAEQIEFIEKPFTADQLVELLQRALTRGDERPASTA